VNEASKPEEKYGG